MNIFNVLKVGMLIKLRGVGLDVTTNQFTKDTICKIVRKNNYSINFKSINNDCDKNTLTYDLLRDYPDAVKIISNNSIKKL